MSQSNKMEHPNVAPNGAKIASLACALWVERGCPEGSPDVDWLEAEEELRELDGQSSRGDQTIAAEPSTVKP